MCTKFGVDSSAVFLLERGQTDRQTDTTRLNSLPTPAAIQPPWVTSEHNTVSASYYIHHYAIFQAMTITLNSIN